MVNLTTLAPDIVEAILEDALPDHLTLFDLAVDPPARWGEQRLLMRPRNAALSINCSTPLPEHVEPEIGWQQSSVAWRRTDCSRNNAFLGFLTFAAYKPEIQF